VPRRCQLSSQCNAHAVQTDGRWSAVSDAEADDDAVSARRQLSSECDADAVRARALQDANSVSTEYRRHQLRAAAHTHAMSADGGRRSVHAAAVP